MFIVFFGKASIFLMWWPFWRIFFINEFEYNPFFRHILEALLVQSSDFITLILFFLNLHPGLQTNMEPKNATFGKGESHRSQGINFEVPCEFSRVFLNFFF